MYKFKLRNKLVNLTHHIVNFERDLWQSLFHHNW